MSQEQEDGPSDSSGIGVSIADENQGEVEAAAGVGSSSSLPPPTNSSQTGQNKVGTVQVTEVDVSAVSQSSDSPMIAIVNPKSGGKAGNRVFRKLSTKIGEQFVFDVTQKGPLAILQAVLPGRNALRCLVCGGDGTVGWVLSEIDKLPPGSPPVEVAILPLGTGNDLARQFQWGGGFSKKLLKTAVPSVSAGSTKELDLWDVSVGAARGEQRKTMLMCNYCSVGLDARIALRFHTARESHPGRFFSQVVNKMWYGMYAAKQMFCSSASLPRVCKLVVDDVEVPIPRGVKGLIVLNIASYAGGRDLWGKKSGGEQGFNDPSLSDGKLEIVAVNSLMHLSFMTMKLRKGRRLAQGSKISLQLQDGDHMPDHLAFQVDGEPKFVDKGSSIDIQLHRRHVMVERDAPSGCCS